jgi:hypothetical protein
MTVNTSFFSPCDNLVVALLQAASRRQPGDPQRPDQECDHSVHTLCGFEPDARVFRPQIPNENTPGSPRQGMYPFLAAHREGKTQGYHKLFLPGPQGQLHPMSPGSIPLLPHGQAENNSSM